MYDEHSDDKGHGPHAGDPGPDEHQHRRRAGGPGNRYRSRPRYGDGPDFPRPPRPPRPGGFRGKFDDGPGFDAGLEFDDEPEFHGHQHGHHRHRGSRPAPEFEGRGFGGPGFPPGFPGFPGGWPRGAGRRGRGRAKRGDVRAAALALLAEEPMNGYQIIQQISERSGGLWRPSPGSVYPALQQLEDEELIRNRSSGSGRAAFELTDAGREYVEAHAAELQAPWSDMAGDGATAAIDMRALVGQLHLAAVQVVFAGTDAQIDQARKVLAQARRALYRILAQDETDDDAAGQTPDPGTEAPSS